MTTDDEELHRHEALRASLKDLDADAKPSSSSSRGWKAFEFTDYSSPGSRRKQRRRPSKQEHDSDNATNKIGSLRSLASSQASSRRKLKSDTAGNKNDSGGSSSLVGKALPSKSKGSTGKDGGEADDVEPTFDNLFERAGLGSLGSYDGTKDDLASTDVSRSDDSDGEKETESQKMRRILYDDGGGGGGNDDDGSNSSSGSSRSRSQSSRKSDSDRYSGSSNSGSRRSQGSGGSGEDSSKSGSSGSSSGSGSGSGSSRGSQSTGSGGKSGSENESSSGNNSENQSETPSSGTSSNENGSDSYAPRGSSSESSSRLPSVATKEKSESDGSRSGSDAGGSSPSGSGSGSGSGSDRSNSYRPGYKSDDGQSAFSQSDSSSSKNASGASKSASKTSQSRGDQDSSGSEGSRKSGSSSNVSGSGQSKSSGNDGNDQSNTLQVEAGKDSAPETDSRNRDISNSIERPERAMSSHEDSIKNDSSASGNGNGTKDEMQPNTLLSTSSKTPDLVSSKKSEEKGTAESPQDSSADRSPIAPRVVKEESNEAEKTSPSNVPDSSTNKDAPASIRSSSSQSSSSPNLEQIKSPMVVLRQLKDMTVNLPPPLDDDKQDEANKPEQTDKVGMAATPNLTAKSSGEYANDNNDKDATIPLSQKTSPASDQAVGTQNIEAEYSVPQPELQAATTLWPKDDEREDAHHIHSTDEIGWKPPTTLALANFGETSKFSTPEKKDDPDDNLPGQGQELTTPIVRNVNAELQSKRSKKRNLESAPPPVPEVTVVPPPDDESTLGTEGVYLERFPPKTKKSSQAASGPKMSNSDTKWTMPAHKESDDMKDPIHPVSEIKASNYVTKWTLPVHSNEQPFNGSNKMKDSKLQAIGAMPSHDAAVNRQDPPGERNLFPFNPQRQVLVTNHHAERNPSKSSSPEVDSSDVVPSPSLSQVEEDRKSTPPVSSSWIPSERQKQALRREKNPIEIYYKRENTDDSDSVWGPPGVARSRSTEDVEIESRRVYVDAIMMKKRLYGLPQPYVDPNQRQKQQQKRQEQQQQLSSRAPAAHIDFSGAVNSSSSSSISRPSSKSGSSYVEIDYSESTQESNNSVFRPNINPYLDGGKKVPEDESFVEIAYSESSKETNNSVFRPNTSPGHGKKLLEDESFVEIDHSSNSSSRTSKNSAFAAFARAPTDAPKPSNDVNAFSSESKSSRQGFNDRAKMQYHGTAPFPQQSGVQQMMNTQYNSDQQFGSVPVPQTGTQYVINKTGPYPAVPKESRSSSDSSSSSSNDSVLRKEKERRTTWIMISLIVLFLVVVGGAVATAIILLNRNNDDDGSPTFAPVFRPPTPSPTPSPTNPTSPTSPTRPPTPAPTVPPGTPTTAPQPTPMPTAPFGTPTTGDNLRGLIVAAYPPGEEALDDPLSPQSLALRWLESSANSAVTTEESYLQRYALATLYFATSGDGWTENTSWLSNTNECSWKSTKPTSIGICDALGRYLELNLESNNLRGSLPPELVLLSSSLKVISLLGNVIGGTVPTFIVDMKFLERFDVSSNQLRGSIPEVLGQATSLKQLSLYDNNLFSTIPASLGSLGRLEVIDLGSNDLSGTIPSTFGQLSRLVGLSVFGNFLTGSLPTELSNLAALELLYVDSNDLGPPVPGGVCELSLVEFWSDCEEIQCLCCTTCCSDDFGCYETN